MCSGAPTRQHHTAVLQGPIGTSRIQRTLTHKWVRPKRERPKPAGSAQAGSSNRWALQVRSSALPNTLIVSAGEIGREMYFLVEGSVQVSLGSLLHGAVLGAGGLLTVLHAPKCAALCAVLQTCCTLLRTWCAVLQTGFTALQDVEPPARLALRSKLHC